MTTHLNQAKHNEAFLKTIDQAASDNYFDWKITVCFYASIHYLRALEKLKKKHIKNSHKDFLYHLNTSHSDAILPINKTVFNHYQDLFNMAHRTRYSGFLDKNFQMSLYKANFEFAKINLEAIKQYCIKQGVK